MTSKDIFFTVLSVLICGFFIITGNDVDNDYYFYVDDTPSDNYIAKIGERIEPVKDRLAVLTFNAEKVYDSIYTDSDEIKNTEYALIAVRDAIHDINDTYVPVDYKDIPKNVLNILKKVENSLKIYKEIISVSPTDKILLNEQIEIAKSDLNGFMNELNTILS